MDAERCARALRGLLAACGLAAGAFVAAEPAAPPPIVQAQRSELPTGVWAAVPLPDRVEADTPAAVARATWRVEADLGPAPGRTALYASGLIGTPRIVLNGSTLLDELADPLPPSPRGVALLRVIELPPALLRPGKNQVEITLARRGAVSLSVLRLGPATALQAQRDAKRLAMVTGPVIVASVLAGLGVTVLVLFLRLRAQRLYGYFGAGATLWSAHTFWTVSPWPLLAGIHFGVWWNTLYAALVVMLSLFCLHYARRARPWIERALLGAALAAPLLLYAAAALGVLGPAAEALRLSLIVMVTAALGAVAHHAWHRRRIDSALLVLSGLAGAGFGLRDWLAFRSGDDNLPVALTPYAGLPFSLLVTWLLIDRFVRATRAAEDAQQQLERRVARREAELEQNFERLAALERAKTAGETRQRVLRELHDGVGARLFTALAKLETGTLATDGAARELRGCLDDMRLAMETLSSGEPELGAAIGNFLFRWEDLLRDAGVQPRWRVELPPEGLQVAPAQALQLLRLMQEALTNVLRHAQAHRVTLALSVDGGALALRIDDDGRGLVPDVASQGRGLAQMRARAEGLGARLSVQPAPGGGTRVDLRLPLPAPGGAH